MLYCYINVQANKSDKHEQTNERKEKKSSEMCAYFYAWTGTVHSIHVTILVLIVIIVIIHCHRCCHSVSGDYVSLMWHWEWNSIIHENETKTKINNNNSNKKSSDKTKSVFSLVLLDLPNNFCVMLRIERSGLFNNFVVVSLLLVRCEYEVLNIAVCLLVLECMCVCMFLCIDVLFEYNPL